LTWINQHYSRSIDESKRCWICSASALSPVSKDELGAGCTLAASNIGVDRIISATLWKILSHQFTDV
jgi:hypothetical protein